MSRGPCALASQSLLEEVGVGPGADQMQLVILDAVNQEPVGLDVELG